MPIDRASFLLLLGASLVLTAITMLIPVREGAEGEPTRIARAMPFIAAPIGFLAGLVGIGGGIFLAPLLHLTRWSNARAIAATASLFILVNSLFGLAGRCSSTARPCSAARWQKRCRCCWRWSSAARSAA